MTKFIDWNNDSNQWKLDDIVEITSLVKKYCDAHGYKNVWVDEVEVELNDKNNRVNISISYINEHNCLFMQYLFIINGEIMDGHEFHKRRKDLYPDKFM